MVMLNNVYLVVSQRSKANFGYDLKKLGTFDDSGVCVVFVTGYIILFLPSKLTKIDD